jgi:hypothetical protein
MKKKAAAILVISLAFQLLAAGGPRVSLAADNQMNVTILH